MTCGGKKWIDNFPPNAPVVQARLDFLFRATMATRRTYLMTKWYIFENSNSPALTGHAFND